MPTVNEIRAAIAAKVRAATGLSTTVHEYERFVKEQSRLRDLYKPAAESRIHGYHVRKTATREVQNAVGSYTIDHSWQVRGFMSLDDADETEKLFDTEIEAVRDAFRDDSDLGLDLASIDDEQAGVQVPESGPVMFCDVLCHSARLAFMTRHFYVGGG